MSYVCRISGTAWSKLYVYLSEFSKIHTSNEAKTRRFVEAVFWIVRSGSQWRLLPAEYGEWNTVYHRFADWADRGVWYKMLYYFAQDPDMEYLMVDSTILRAHACAAGAIKKNMADSKSKL
jgi:putative transposase